MQGLELMLSGQSDMGGLFVRGTYRMASHSSANTFEAWKQNGRCFAADGIFN